MPLLCERVLIVDDDADFREALGEVLETAGAIVRLASDPEGALNEIQRGFEPRVVLLDLQFDGANGKDLLDRLRRDVATRYVPVVVMSGSPRLAATVTGADAVLVKPFDVEALYRTVSNFCGRTA